MEVVHGEKVRQALDLVEKGFATAYFAAKIVGISSSTLYKSKEYQALMLKKKEDEMVISKI